MGVRKEISRHVNRTSGQPKEGFVSVGSIRGWCGHVHRTLDAAIKCSVRDGRDCGSTGGYSDRGVYRLMSHGKLRNVDPMRYQDHERELARNGEI
jgi:hypothetical protein